MRTENPRAPRETREGASDRSVCRHSGCPGCPLLRLPYSEQLLVKRELVARCFEAEFRPLGLALPEVSEVRPSPRLLGYRAGAKLVLGRKGGRVHVGLYREGSHRVVDLPRCPVHHPLIGAGAQALRALLARAPAFLSEGLGGLGWLRYAAFQVSTLRGALSVSLVTRSPEHPGVLQSLGARLRERVPEISGIVRNVNPTAGNAIFGREWHPVWGEPLLEERLGDHIVRVSPGSFLQANREQAGWAYRTAAEWLRVGAAEEAWDLYCGVGGIALHLAAGARRVRAVESSPDAVRDAKASAASLGLRNLEFAEAGAGEGMSALEQLGRPHAVALNPPRGGAAREVLEKLVALRPRAIFYLSCNPKTLARDAALLCGSGAFRLERVQPVDFFPHTAHVETAALFAAAG
jgi:23S rRNA (uracil1939-C5)-methyltransferase